MAMSDELHLLSSYKSLLFFSSPVLLPDTKIGLFILPIKINPHNFFFIIHFLKCVTFANCHIHILFAQGGYEKEGQK